MASNEIVPPVERVDIQLEAAQLIARGLTKEQAQEILDDVAMSNEISQYLSDLAARMEKGETVSREEVDNHINRIAESYGHHYGVPMPSMADLDRPMVLAEKAPLRYTNAAYHAQTEMEQALRERQIPVRNSWNRLGDVTVCVVDTENGPMWLKQYHAGTRLRHFMDTATMRSGSQQTAEAELKAMESLKARIGKGQWESYVLNGSFPEKSEKSDLFYIFRKGLPTLAISWHGNEQIQKNGRVIAALCMHPLGYYQNTFCGLMCPTDELIAHLLLMRSDERRYWAKCGQWSMHDPRSGV